VKSVQYVASYSEWIAYSGAQVGLFYWRTPSGADVDFVIYLSDGFCAIDVKISRRLQSSDLRSIKAFSRDYPECTAIFVYRGSEKLRIDGELHAFWRPFFMRKTMVKNHAPMPHPVLVGQRLRLQPSCLKKNEVSFYCTLSTSHK
jgi:hypothetical protein